MPQLHFVDDSNAELVDLTAASIGAASATDIATLQNQIATLRNELTAAQTAIGNTFKNKTFTLTVRTTAS